MRTLLPLAGCLLALWSVPRAVTAQEIPRPAEPRAPSRPTVDFQKFKFLEGCWRTQVGKEEWVEENWTSPSDNLLLATTRYLTKERATGYEFTRIQWMDSVVVFAAASNGKPEDVYPLKTLAEEFVIFENLTKKTFPQRIMYRLASDGALIPRNEGEGPSIEVRLERVTCPGSSKR